MKLIFIAILTFAAAVAGLSVDEDDKDACMEEIDGQLVENLADCSTYYSCKDQIPEKKECMDDLLFDAKNLTCALPDTVTTCENRPTSKNDPCPALGKGIFRLDYPGTPAKYPFYILCKNGKNKGYRRKVFHNGKWEPDQRYFRDCPAKGRVKVLYVQHPDFYFLCEDGIHTKTRPVPSTIESEIINPKDLPKKPELKVKKGNKKYFEMNQKNQVMEVTMADKKMKSADTIMVDSEHGSVESTKGDDDDKATIPPVEI